MQENTENKTEYSVFIASPTSGEVFNFTNENETIPIEIKAKEVESSDYTINIFVNENKIKSFTSPPYKYNWNPGSSGEYKIIARLVDDDNNVIAESNAITFTVQYESEPENEADVSTDIKEKKTNVIYNSNFRYDNTIPAGL
ncbi:MAG: Ig-like domain-containing protein, partial [Candidatus Humimicrobiaceae bacterium]|nr:Ig-like domain-containing protein [Candidatus Humimicrobiaceae bacterium]